MFQIIIKKNEPIFQIRKVVKEILINASGKRGPQGEPGVGVPAGGTIGQFLAKNSNTDYDTEWIDAAGLGDMVKAVYDPNNINDDAFDMENMIEGLTKKILTSAERTKLAGIAAGAEVNVNADWDAVAGDALILNKPTSLSEFTNDVGFITNLSSFTTTNLAEGSNLYFTNERVDDRVAALLVAGAGITINYNDPANTLTILSTITQYTDELAQDAVGGILVDSAEIDFTYNDTTPSITASIIAGSIDESKLDTSVNASLDLADTAIQNLAGLGITATATEINYIDGVTSALQTQLDNKQPLNAILTDLAGLTQAANKIIYFDTGTTAATTDLTAFMRGLLGSADAAAARDTLNVEIGVDVQAWDTLLDSIAALADPNADRILFWDDSAGAMAWLTPGTNLSISGTTLNATTGGGGTVNSVVAGTGIDVDDTDPANPIVALDSATQASLALADSAVQDLADLGITASAAELNILDGATLTVTELNYVDGVTSAIQTQLDGKQPLDSDLTTLASLTATTDNFIVSVASAWASRTPSQVRTTLGLVIGTNVQAYSANLDEYAAVNPTAAGLALLDDADAAAQLVTLGFTASITELNYTDGVTSAIQTQLDAKLSISAAAAAYQPLDSDLTTLAGLTATTDNFIVSVASAWASRTPAQVRTTLGLVIGTDVQAYDADLATIAGLTATTDNFMVAVASAWASRTPAQVRTTLALVIGTNVQAWDADLDAIAALSPSNDDIIQRKSGAWTNRTMAQLKTDLALVKGDVGLGNVDNTSDATKNSATATLTNKRITPRISSTASGSSVTPTKVDYDRYVFTALAAGLTIANPTMDIGEVMAIQILDNGTTRALTWGNQYVGIDGQALCATTVVSKQMEFVITALTSTKYLVTYVTEA